MSVCECVRVVGWVGRFVVAASAWLRASFSRSFRGWFGVASLVVFFFCLVVAFVVVVLYFLRWWQYRHRIGKGYASANY